MERLEVGEEMAPELLDAIVAVPGSLDERAAVLDRYLDSHAISWRNVSPLEAWYIYRDGNILYENVPHLH